MDIIKQLAPTYLQVMSFIDENNKKYFKENLFYLTSLETVKGDFNIYFTEEMLENIKKYQKNGYDFSNQNFSVTSYEKNYAPHYNYKRSKQQYLSNPEKAFCYSNIINEELMKKQYNDYSLLQLAAFKAGALFSDRNFNKLRNHAKCDERYFYNENEIIKTAIHIKYLFILLDNANTRKDIDKITDMILSKHNEIFMLARPLLQSINKEYGYDIRFDDKNSAYPVIINKLIFSVAKEKCLEQKETEKTYTKK